MRARTRDWTIAGGALVAFSLVALASCSSDTSSGGSGGEGAAAAVETLAPVTTEAPTTTVEATTTTVKKKPKRTTTTTEATTTTTVPKTTTTTTTIPPVNALQNPLVAIGTGSGGETERIQQRLLDLGFWHDGVDGVYGLTTSQAVMAFQKYMGIYATGGVDQETADALASKMERPKARANSGTLVEIDKDKQLLFFVIDGKTEYILNTSTGSGEPYEKPDQNTPGETVSGDSQTPNGLHNVNRERADGWWEGDLGKIYRPKYFVGGVAVHGSNSIPNYPASHGCVRVSVPAMDWIWDSGILPMYTPVWVHEGA